MKNVLYLVGEQRLMSIMKSKSHLFDANYDMLRLAEHVTLERQQENCEVTDEIMMMNHIFKTIVH